MSAKYESIDVRPMVRANAALSRETGLSAERLRDDRWRGCCAALAYRPEMLSNPTRRRGGDTYTLLDQGFTARRRADNLSVMFGDPYDGPWIDDAVARVQAKYGLLVRRHPGLWLPGATVLLELIVIDPRRALEMFGDRRALDSRRPARYLGQRVVTLRELRP